MISSPAVPKPAIAIKTVQIAIFGDSGINSRESELRTIESKRAGFLPFTSESMLKNISLTIMDIKKVDLQKATHEYLSQYRENS